MSTIEKLHTEWAEKYRAPVVSHDYNLPSYVACLIFPDVDDPITELWKLQAPSEEDAELLGKYIEFRIARWYNERWINLMREKPLDIDSGVNTVIFRKSEKGWHFTRISWRSGPPFLPSLFDEKQYPTLLELIDFERRSGERVDEHWEEFKRKNRIGNG